MEPGGIAGQVRKGKEAVLFFKKEPKKFWAFARGIRRAYRQRGRRLFRRFFKKEDVH
jgi:hypothetical protein